ncbi:hypothetical protein D3C81_1760840 [compost metagenome]
MASRIETERSFKTCTLIDAGIWSLNCGKVSFTASTTATVFAFGWRCTANTMDGSPFTQLPLLVDSTLSSTTATSLRRVVWPLRLLMTRLLNASALRNCLLACRVRVWRVPSSTPTGEFAFAARSANATSSSVILRAANSSGLTLTRTAKRRCP